MDINFFVEKDFMNYSLPLYLREKIELFIRDAILLSD